MLLLAKKFARDIPALIRLVIVIAAITIAIAGPWIAPPSRRCRRLASDTAAEAAECCLSVRDRQSRTRSAVAGHSRYAGCARSGPDRRCPGGGGRRPARPRRGIRQRLAVRTNHAYYRRV